MEKGYGGFEGGVAKDISANGRSTMVIHNL